jgi:hypothetical protein
LESPPDLSLLSKKVGCTTLGNVVSDFRLTSFSAEILKGGQAIPGAQSCERQVATVRSGGVMAMVTPKEEGFP